MSTTQLALTDEVIEQYGLVRCYYLSLSCWNCGELRVVIPQIPESRFFPCPRCGGNAAFTVMGSGGTVRPLPCWDRLVIDQLRAFWKRGG